jgi:hypothetical protein
VSSPARAGTSTGQPFTPAPRPPRQGASQPEPARPEPARPEPADTPPPWSPSTEEEGHTARKVAGAIGTGAGTVAVGFRDLGRDVVKRIRARKRRKRQ